MKKLFGFLLAVLLLGACNSQTGLYKQAQLAASKGDFGKAVQLYSQYLKQYPHAAAAYINRGLAWEYMPAKDAQEKRKNQGFAEEDYLRAVDEDRTFAEAYNNLGALYIEQGRYEEAVPMLTAALSFAPSYFLAQMNRAIAFARLGKIDVSLKDFRAAEALRKDEPLLYLNRGIVYYNIKQYVLAVEDFSHAIFLSPDDAHLYLERARALMALEYPASAFADLEEAVTLKPTYALAYYYMGDLLYRRGDREMALGYMARAKELANQYVPIYDLMGDMLVLDDAVAATANYMVAKKLDPAHAAKYQRKINLMKTEEGRQRIVAERFKPKDM